MPFWSAILLPVLATRLLLLLVGVVTTYYVEPLIDRHQPIQIVGQGKEFPAMLWLMWLRFDSNFYLGIAQGGYWDAASLHGASNWAFFPLFPLLLRALALPFGASTTALTFAGILVANGATVVAALYLYKLTAREFSHSVAARAVFYLALFPLSYYLSAVYPESLFLALSLACVYYARTRRWWLAGLCGGLAALTRPQGVLLVAVAGWEYWQWLAKQYYPREARAGVAAVRGWLLSRTVGLVRAARSWSTWRGIAALLQIPLALAFFCLYAKWKVDTFLPFTVTEREGWGRHFRNPVKFLLETVMHPVAPNPYDWNFYALSILCVLIMLLLLVPLFRRLPTIYGIFTVLFFGMPLTTGSLQSSARFMLGIFPLYLLLAWWTSRGSGEQQSRRHTYVVATFAALLALATVLLTLGVYSMS
ncbi:MAG: hypothetical protein PVS3B1_28240 [Ktedonobacteraceae bacterium]